jgi:hypothetical protein
VGAALVVADAPLGGNLIPIGLGLLLVRLARLLVDGLAIRRLGD